MTHLLEKALEEISRLPVADQDALAAILLGEIASERRWTESFSKSQDALAKLAEEALTEYGQGRTRPM
jgi:hypothetical protein